MDRGETFPRTPDTLELLLVEDNPGDADLVSESLWSISPSSFSITHVSRLNDALARLRQGPYSVVLLDLSLPDAHGLHALKQAQLAAAGVPIVVMTGLDDEALALEAVQSGAQDYLVK